MRVEESVGELAVVVGIVEHQVQRVSDLGAQYVEVLVHGNVVHDDGVIQFVAWLAQLVVGRDLASGVADAVSLQNLVYQLVDHRVLVDALAELAVELLDLLETLVEDVHFVDRYVDEGASA